jgi:hypothetical protein
LKAVVHNFLGTFASRHSEYSGYWIVAPHDPTVEYQSNRDGGDGA